MVARILEQSEKSSQSWTDLKVCLSSRIPKHQCFQTIERTCRNADTRVAKVLRLRLHTMKMLLNLFPNVLVLYLVRDPRAIINSRIETKWFPLDIHKPVMINQNIESLCLKMNNDLADFLSLGRTYSSRVHYVKFESLVSDTQNVKRLYATLNITMDKPAKTFIESVVKENRKRDITGKWKSTLDDVYKANILKQCKTFALGFQK